MAIGVYKHKAHQGFQKGHKLFMNPESLRGRRLSPSTEFKKGMIPWNKGVPWSDDIKRRISKSKMGSKNPHSPEWRRKVSEAQRGEKSHLWEGGKTSVHETIRRNVEYRLWREAVFARDRYTCQICSQRGGELNADHIKPFAHYPELRFAIDNGRTLCVACHRKTPTYGGRVRSGAYKQWL